MKGIFHLTTAPDLRNKLRRDLERLKKNFMDSDAAFNFFVTAEHLLDWVYPGQVNEKKRKKARKDSILLAVCSHLASGAKHFEVEARHHKSVTSTGTGGGHFGSNHFASYAFANAAFGRRLIVRLDGEAEKQIGPAIRMVDLAKRIMDYWEKHPLS